MTLKVLMDVAGAQISLRIFTNDTRLERSCLCFLVSSPYSDFLERNSIKHSSVLGFIVLMGSVNMMLTS